MKDIYRNCMWILPIKFRYASEKMSLNIMFLSLLATEKEEIRQSVRLGGQIQSKFRKYNLFGNQTI